MEEKNEFAKLSVKSDVKHEIDIIAATERRFVYEVVADMLKLYKHVAIAKGKDAKSPKSNGKNSKSTSALVSEWVTEQASA